MVGSLWQASCMFFATMFSDWISFLIYFNLFGIKRIIVVEEGLRGQ
jgi:hypothetical protein